MVRTAVGSIAFAPFTASEPTAAGATWGVPGSTYLAGFTIAAVLVLGGTALALGVIPHLRSGGADVVRTESGADRAGHGQRGRRARPHRRAVRPPAARLLGNDGLPGRRTNALTSSPTGLARTVSDAVGRGVRPTVRSCGRDAAVTAELERCTERSGPRVWCWARAGVGRCAGACSALPSW